MCPPETFYSHIHFQCHFHFSLVILTSLLFCSAYLEINSSPRVHVLSLAAYLLLGLAIAQTHITNRLVYFLKVYSIKIYIRHFNCRYLLLMLVVHAMTLEHIGGIAPLFQLPLPGFIKTF